MKKVSYKELGLVNTRKMFAKAVKGDVRAFREIQNVVEKAEGGHAQTEREEDALSKSLRELGESL